MPIQFEDEGNMLPLEWLGDEEPRAVGELAHVETFFVRNLGGLIDARIHVPGRLGKARSRTPSMYVDAETMLSYKSAVAI